MKFWGKGRNRREGGVKERGNTRPTDPSFKNILLETKAPRIENSFVVSPTLGKKISVIIKKNVVRIRMRKIHK